MLYVVYFDNVCIVSYVNVNFDLKNVKLSS
jgi:hypothetical protein